METGADKGQNMNHDFSCSRVPISPCPLSVYVLISQTAPFGNK
ncbi:hypothetical protein [Chlorogloeopsis sp. ULAP01]|nr:hypothetical protein [Chlorogloeopsis sp. ULAP01]